MCVHMCHVYMYRCTDDKYIGRERERERVKEMESERDGEREYYRVVHVQMWHIPTVDHR